MWGGAGVAGHARVGPAAGAHARPTRALTGSCLSRSISVYKSSQDSKKVRLQHFFTPDRSTVLSLACTPHSLYAGLVNGAVAVYAKAEGNCVCTVCGTSTRPVSWRFLGVCCGRSCMFLGHVPTSVCHRASQGTCSLLNPKRTVRSASTPSRPQPHGWEVVSDTGLPAHASPFHKVLRSVCVLLPTAETPAPSLPLPSLRAARLCLFGWRGPQAARVSGWTRSAPNGQDHLDACAGRRPSR